MLKQSVKIMLLMTAIGLAGCATEQNYHLATQSWVNAPIEQLRHSPRWSIPNNTLHLANGNRAYVYYHRYTIRIPTTYVQGDTYVTHPTPNTTVVTHSPGYYQPGYTQHYKCTTMFEFNADKIIERAYYRGNACALTEKQLPLYARPGVLNIDKDKSK